MSEFLHWLQGTMSVPTWFGWYHILWLFIMIAGCVVIYIFRNKISKKAINIILLTISIILIVFEVYKQIIFSFYYNDGNPTWSFQWYAFPFQFCSTPMYLMLIAGISRKGKLYNCIISYLATFALFAGLCVMIYPGDVFTFYIGINIQTMFWHSSMFIIGFMLLATRSVEFKFKTILKASYVFCVMLAIALCMNILWHFYGTDATFNMFYISPYLPCTLPLLSIIYENTPYIIFLISYIIGFTLAASIMLSFAILFDKLEKKLQQRTMSEDEIAITKILEIINKKL